MTTSRLRRDDAEISPVLADVIKVFVHVDQLGLRPLRKSRLEGFHGFRLNHDLNDIVARAHGRQTR